MYSQEEKILILGSLLHDIGKFNQRCTGNPNRETHQSIGEKLIDDFHYLFTPIVGDDLTQLKKIIKQHHNKEVDRLTEIVKIADWISAGERVKKDETEKEFDEKWSHKFLSSLFSKINLKSDDSTDTRYYKQEYLINKNYEVLIPRYQTEQQAIQPGNYYNSEDWKNFIDDLKIVFEKFKDDDDFDTLINLTLLVFEKYMWCIPDFTGNPETDISLYNHLKDVCALSHSIYKTKENNNSNKKLALIVGDLPGIQKYIFGVLNPKAAKMLRGRSAFIQILSRNIATEFLNAFGLTECNLVMLAGGKFYIITQCAEGFNSTLSNCKKRIEDYLYDELKLDLRFVIGKEIFDYDNFSFGKVVEGANKDLLNEKNKSFSNIFFNKNSIKENKFIYGDGFTENSEPDSNKIKCELTDQPVLKGRNATVNVPAENGQESIFVDKQVKVEYMIGDNIVDNNTVVEFSNNDDKNKGLLIEKVFEFGKEEISKNKRKIVINPVLEELLKSGDDKISLLKGTRFLEVANYVSKNGRDVLDFEKMSEKPNGGAEYLTLIKGDIDNLGLIMAYGLDEELKAISRTTTLSNHLKYFFSFFINGFLKDKDNAEQIKSYTIFAGGDDLMLVCHQSDAVKLLDEFNKVVKDFVCENKEMHITYSVTHFKHNTPIKIVSGFAEDNQDTSKNLNESKINLNVPSCFKEENNKASTLIFNTKLKNSKLEDLRSYTFLLAKWVNENEQDRNKGISMGVLRNLLQLVEILKQYREKKDTSKLIWHPMLTYMINRNLKDKNGIYKDTEVGNFFDDVLKFSKNEEEIEFEKILYPAICGAIYKLRS